MDQKLLREVRYGYAIGHFFNDCCASMWFTYLILYFKKVVNLSKEAPPILLLIGQLVDGFVTPIIGILTDKYKLLSVYSKRKTWHLIGTVLVAVSFTFIFQTPYSIPELDSFENSTMNDVELQYAKFIYYIPFISIFQIGWATVQISHLSLIPCLAKTDKQKADLNSLRYAVLIFANTLVYLLAFFLFKEKTKEETKCDQHSITESKGSVFTTLALSTVAVGSFVSLAFHYLVTENEEDCQDCDEEKVLKPNENKLRVPLQMERLKAMTGGSTCSLASFSSYSSKKNYLEETEVKEKTFSPKDWLMHPPLYVNAVIYTAARIATNCLQIYLTLYITDTIQLKSFYIAVLPFIQYIFGFIASFSTKYIHKIWSTKTAYVIGSGVVMLACLWVVFIPTDGFSDENRSTGDMVSIFTIFALFGGGTNMVVCAALGLTAELIGDNHSSGAFVYGLMSFGDKVINGLTVVVLEKLNSCNNIAPDETRGECSAGSICEFYGQFVSYGTSGILIFGLIFILIQHKSSLKSA